MLDLDAIRFCIGPWNDRFSSVWRVWTNPGATDVFLAVRSLAGVFKISLHQSGICRAAFTESYAQELAESGLREKTKDRALTKWARTPLNDNEIQQVLDIHFPLSVLSLGSAPEIKKKKGLFIVKPDAATMGDNDSVTVKILMHKTHPDSEVFVSALGKKNLMPMFFLDLNTDEFLTIAFCYTKQLPLDITEEEKIGMANMFRDRMVRLGKAVGDSMENLTMQTFKGGSPPEVFNVGRVGVSWEEEKHFLITVTNDSN